MMSGFIRKSATRSLGRIGPAAKPYVPVLIDAIKRYRGSDVSWYAAEGLGNIADPNDAVVIAVLEEAAKNGYELEREKAGKKLFKNYELHKEQLAQKGYVETDHLKVSARRGLEKLAARRGHRALFEKDDISKSTPDQTLPDK